MSPGNAESIASRRFAFSGLPASTSGDLTLARHKGKWAGGHPLLAYDIAPQGFKLVVNEDEAFRVRAIFDLYLEHQAMIPVIKELERRGWHNKRWTTRKGHERGGKPFTKTSLHKLLMNIQEAILLLPRTERGRDPIHVHELQPIAAAPDWRKQRRLWRELQLASLANLP